MCNSKSQDIFEISNRIEKISKKKEQSIDVNCILADYFEKVERKPGKAHNLRNCASYLLFQRFCDEENTKKLVSAKFCKHPLCVMCQWRNRIKTFINVSEGLKLMRNGGGVYRIYFLTLTVQNWAKIDQKRIRDFQKKSVEFIREVLNTKSYYMSLEITVAKDGGYHPHIHAIVATEDLLDISVKSIALYRRLWCLIYGEKKYKYLLVTLYPLAKNSISEVTKYILKPSEYIGRKEIIEIAKAIHNVKKTFSSGDIRKYLKIAKEKLAAEDEQENIRLSSYDYVLELYRWLGNSYFLSEQQVQKLRNGVKGRETTCETLDVMKQGDN